MAKYILSFAFLLLDINAIACTTCNAELQKAIYKSAFLPNLLTMLSAFIAIAILVAVFSAMALRRHKAHVARYPNRVYLTPVPLTAAATVLGIGVGGFLDGIILHQVLQWHEMLSNKIPPDTLLHKSINMFWDGVFHFFCLIVTIIGIILLWKMLLRTDIDRSGRLLGGGMLLGWGVFNIVEGVIDHHLLKLHNVREVSSIPDVWNYSFLAVSVLMIILGYALVNKKLIYTENHPSST
jgi:uncharacterized membrane protein